MRDECGIAQSQRALRRNLNRITTSYNTGGYCGRSSGDGTHLLAAAVTSAATGWPTRGDATATVGGGSRGSVAAASAALVGTGAAGTPTRSGKLRGADFGGSIVIGCSSRDTDGVRAVVVTMVTKLACLLTCQLRRRR
jgi:hypothetical protein